MVYPEEDGEGAGEDEAEDVAAAEVVDVLVEAEVVDTSLTK